MKQTPQRREQIQQLIVTAEQMSAIESRLFTAGMPVAALMEKVAGLIARQIVLLWSENSNKIERDRFPLHPATIINYPDKIGVLVGPGHNGGDALVVARELFFQDYEVIIYHPFQKRKELTDYHAKYAASLGISFVAAVEELQDCDLLIDGLFGFGLTRSLTDPIASEINRINEWSIPIISIDLPSGLQTDTGEVLGTAIRATKTFCLGLWKQAFLQDQALDYIGEAELIDFDIPLADIQAILGESPSIQRITPSHAIAHLPLPRPPATYKYKLGHLLIICGSRTYTGAAILTGLAARASGIGMLSIAVPESIKPLLSTQLPEALIIGCPETENGAIAQLPDRIDLDSYSAIACGPGLTREAKPVIEGVILDSDLPLILDADGLNIVAELRTIPTLSKRNALTILTPHAGEFKRLFPELADPKHNRITAVQKAAQQSKSVVVLKGARTAIAYPNNTVWINPESTPALARGGSGDVLTGLLSGLVAQAATAKSVIEPLVQTAVWWHAQAGILAAQERTEMGVDAFTLTQYLMPVLRSHQT